MTFDFKYVNSKNQTIDLTKPPFIGEISNDLLSFKWTPITQGQAVQKIVGFDKTMVQKNFHVVISGNNEREYYGNLEKFLQRTDVDINNKKMGRLYINDYYLECFLIASSKPKRYIHTSKTMIECTAVCERGNWQSEELFPFRAVGGYQGASQYTANGIIYDYDYPYDFSSPFGRTKLENISYLDSDFELTFYGAMLNPKIIIGGNTYEFIDTPISADEKIIVNSQKKTALLYRQNGDIENVFSRRNKLFDIYAKVKGGLNTVSVDDDFNIDLKLFYERSEPKWSNEIWI